MSLAIVFSELTCKKWDNGVGANYFVFRELIDNSSVTINVLLSDCQGQSKKQVAASSVHKTPTWCLYIHIYIYIE